MKISNAIRKLEKAGYTVSATSFSQCEPKDQPLAWVATKTGRTHLIEFLRNGRDDEITCIRVRRPSDKDDLQTDYFAGAFYDNMKQAMEAVERFSQSDAELANRPSLRARIRSAEWFERTEGGRHEDELDRKARAEFEAEAQLLPQKIRDALARVEA